VFSSEYVGHASRRAKDVRAGNNRRTRSLNSRHFVTNMTAKPQTG
jgi:hypothetical protein